LGKPPTSAAARPTISIAVITHNHERFIGTAIESALAQDADEIIVVDDGSTDATRAVAAGYSDDRLRVTSKRNGGPSSALNAALDLTRGDVLVPFSGDDLLLPNSVAERAEILAASGADYIWSVPRFIDENGRALSGGQVNTAFRHPGSLRPLDVFDVLWRNGNFVSAASIAMTRHMWEVVGTFDETLWQLQDYDYWLRASARDMQMLVGTAPFAAYRLHGANLSLSNASRLEAELDKTMLAAVHWLDRRQLSELLFRIEGVEASFGLDALKAMLCFTHPRPAVSSAGKATLRAMSESGAFADLKRALTPAIRVRARGDFSADRGLAAGR
jgi:glycosyltransferase involved in cell wall biosynthesis